MRLLILYVSLCRRYSYRDCTSFRVWRIWKVPHNKHTKAKQHAVLFDGEHNNRIQGRPRSSLTNKVSRATIVFLCAKMRRATHCMWIYLVQQRHQDCSNRIAKGNLGAKLDWQRLIMHETLACDRKSWNARKFISFFRGQSDDGCIGVK